MALEQTIFGLLELGSTAPGGGGSGLTDAELRAADVKVTLDGEGLKLDQTTLDALEEINVTLLNPSTDYATEVTLAALLTEMQAKADLAETQPVSAATLPLPTGAATAANQLADNHNVTVSNPTADPETGLAKETTLQTEFDATQVKLDTIAGNQLPDGHNVTVDNLPATYPNQHTQGLTDTELRATAVSVTTTNPTADPETGLAKDATITTFAAKVPDTEGTWGYVAGTSGTEVIPANKRVLQITAIALGAAASLTINAGDTITIPYNSTDKTGSGISIEPKGNLTAPTLVFTATKAYFVEFVE